MVGLPTPDWEVPGYLGVKSRESRSWGTEGP